jgi:5-methyltetrahydrofolate--homocysteine methyltransferase
VGLCAQEALGPEDLIAEKYTGIRPAPGYPACPDHSVKKDMFALLQCEDIGMGVTESLAMTPAASVSGFLPAHPDSTYFSVGKIILEDQLAGLRWHVVWAAGTGRNPGRPPDAPSA